MFSHHCTPVRGQLRHLIDNATVDVTNMFSVITQQFGDRGLQRRPFFAFIRAPCLISEFPQQLLQVGVRVLMRLKNGPTFVQGSKRDEEEGEMWWRKATKNIFIEASCWDIDASKSPPSWVFSAPLAQVKEKTVDSGRSGRTPPILGRD